MKHEQIAKPKAEDIPNIGSFAYPTFNIAFLLQGMCRVERLQKPFSSAI